MCLLIWYLCFSESFLRCFYWWSSCGSYHYGADRQVSSKAERVLDCNWWLIALLCLRERKNWRYTLYSTPKTSENFRALCTGEKVSLFSWFFSRNRHCSDFVLYCRALATRWKTSLLFMISMALYKCILKFLDMNRPPATSAGSVCRPGQRHPSGAAFTGYIHRLRPAGMRIGNAGSHVHGSFPHYDSRSCPAFVQGDDKCQSGFFN